MDIGIGQIPHGYFNNSLGRRRKFHPRGMRVHHGGEETYQMFEDDQKMDARHLRFGMSHRWGTDSH